tara:strand:- start:8248 stop:9006 length:759 start_codon:yes stop_codon:yes gene_type:complete
MAQDLSGQMSNPFASLGVATQAAEIQMEQTDIALANTLDTIRATGSGAGGATALAQAALQGKKGVAASIESQEAANEKARAQGEQQLQSMQTAEKQRLQNINISEGQRMQNADAAGKQFTFNATEVREAGQLDRVSAQLSGSAAREAQAASDQTGAISGMIGGLASVAGSTVQGMKAGSDRRMKNNIKLIGKSKNGLNIYAFEYIDKIFGQGFWQGVMSDEIPSHAVIKNFNGKFDGVDYSKIDVEFKRYKS